MTLQRSLLPAPSPGAPAADVLEQRRISMRRRSGKRNRAFTLWTNAKALFAASVGRRPMEVPTALVAMLESLRLAFRVGSETVAGKKQRRAVHTSEDRQWGDAMRLLVQAARDRSAKSHDPFERCLAQERVLLYGATPADRAASLAYQAHRTVAERMAAQLQQLRMAQRQREEEALDKGHDDDDSSWSAPVPAPTPRSRSTEESTEEESTLTGETSSEASRDPVVRTLPSLGRGLAASVASGLAFPRRSRSKGPRAARVGRVPGTLGMTRAGALG